MRKRIISSVLFVALAVAGIVSCTKKNESTAPTQSLNKVFKDLRSASQHFSVKAGRDTVVYG